MSPDKKNWRKNVAEEMIRHIEQGTAPWQKPWKAGEIGQGQHNPTNDRAYQGINQLWLEMQGHSDPRWMTFNQASQAGARIRAGEKSSQVEYWMWTKTKPMIGEDGVPVIDANGKPVQETVKLERPQVFYANVFNAEQMDGLQPYVAPALSFEPVAEAEKILSAGGVEIIHDQKDRAYYSPTADHIRMPSKTAFPDAYEYYATALHELGHATGHSTRLNRSFGPFGSEVYAKEELRAELTSYMVARDLGLGHYPDRHASYCDSWIKAIREDHNIMFQAARDAEQISQWIKSPELRPALELKAQENRKGVKMAREQNQEQVQSAAPQQSENVIASRTYLAVPYEEKDQAKALGAKWSRKQKSWYVPEAASLADFAKWQLENQPKGDVKEIEPVKEFAEELKQLGVVLKGDPVMDGKWHRVAFETDRKGAQNASYRGFLDGRPNGQLKNFVSNELSQWVATGESLRSDQLSALRAEAAEKQARRAEEQRARQEVVAEKCRIKFEQAAAPAGHIWNGPDDKALSAMSEDERLRWKAAKQGKVDEKYLMRKGVHAYGVGEQDHYEILVPARDINGKLWSIQTIDSYGTKRFEKGGRKEGLMHIIDPDNNIGDKSSLVSTSKIGKGSILIAEGYATAASIHEATKRPVVVAFDAGNLKPVAEAIRQRYPNATLVIAADNDHKHENSPIGNVGWKHAVQAAEQVGGYVVTPEFNSEEKKQGLSDWNDLAQANGSAIVAQQMRGQLKRQKTLDLGPKAEKLTQQM